MIMNRIVRILIVCVLLLLPFVASAPIECRTDKECRDSNGDGSTCLTSGKCSNRFMDGCLRRMEKTKGKYSKRHCNSDDQDESLCRVSPFQYPEIRVHNQNWVVAIFFSWILQIGLMELLDVPVTVGLGDDTNKSSFYNSENTMPYSKMGYGWHALRKANELGGNCLLTEEDCAHVIPDVWLGQQKKYDQEYEDGQLDYLDGNGQVGKIGWYVPKYTASRYPFSVTYMGLSSNREKVAEVFKRPTTWEDYCHEVSQNNCTLEDDIAARYPIDDGEKGSYFSSDNYKGHFRATEENDCSVIDSNNTCTGHIVGAPCGWSTFLESQAFWNNIPLISSGGLVNRGYTYGQMIQIWRAANATNSDVIMWWYEPDTLLEEFRNTDYMLTKVYLPSPSVECLNHRVDPEARCDANPKVRLGNKLGSCDNQPHVTKKAIARSLRDNHLLESEEDQSPAYSFVRNFNIDELEITTMLQHFVTEGGTGYAAREAVCGWIANNTEYLESLIPPNHPRVFKVREDYSEAVTVVAYSVASAALLYLLVSSVITFKKRKAAVFVYSQVQFIFAMLFGLFLVAIGAILHGIEPNATICVLRVWLVSLGYTLLLAPLIIKVMALNRLMRASRRMRRVKINLKQLYFSVLGLAGIVTIYLIVWTIVDPITATEVRNLGDDRITITSHYGCRSESGYWEICYLIWEGILVLWCSVLAFQSRNAKAEFNESKSLGMLIYSHFVFSILRIIFFVVFENDVYTTSLANSFLLSFDIIIAITIYLLPKMVKPNETIREARRRECTRYSASLNSIQENADHSAHPFQRNENGSTHSFSATADQQSSQPFENDDCSNSSVNKSYLLSFEQIVAIAIYLLPKLSVPSETTRESTHLLDKSEDESNDEDEFEKSTSTSKDSGEHSNNPAKDSLVQ